MQRIESSKMMDIETHICWIEREDSIFSAYRVPGPQELYLSVKHAFDGQNGAVLKITCGSTPAHTSYYRAHDIGDDIVLVSGTITPLPFSPKTLSWKPPAYCFGWTLMPAQQIPEARNEIESEINNSLDKIQQVYNDKPNSSFLAFSNVLLSNYSDDFSLSNMWGPTLNDITQWKPTPTSKKEYRASSMIFDSYRLVFVKSWVSSFVTIGSYLWTNCEGWKGTSGGVVVNEDYGVMAVTTGMGSQLTNSFREISSFGILKHTLIE